MDRDSTPPAFGVRPPADFNPRSDPPLDFPDGEYGTLTDGDYQAVGFMSGLEVHQQILTRSKLFCRCPAGRYGTTHDAEVLRHMRPTLSELGEYDGTALMEFKTKKEIVYRLERSTACTYEIDDTPPFEMDPEAIGIALELAQLLGLNLVAELHVMRKQYLDGSIPTGFQRTAMVGLHGCVPFVIPELGVSRELRIRQLSLEEDSCREVSDVGHRVVFATDRLGIPLTEVVTEPDLLTPLEVREGGQLLADVARATGHVRRGPGAARQDVNVSVAGGRRIEIKGVHYHRRLPELVHIEAFRQLNLLRVSSELVQRGVKREMLSIPADGLPWENSKLVADVSDVMGGSRMAEVRDAVGRGETVCAVKLPEFGGLLPHRTQPGVTFAQEFSERVRVIACPVSRPFMLHSDADPDVRSDEWREVRRRLEAGSHDTLVLVWAPQADAATAAREILLRGQDAIAGIPPETRMANRDGTTGFERILPGPDRMYPDTDTPPIPVADSLVEQIRLALPATPWKREEHYMGLGLGPAKARQLARSWWADLFDAADPSAGPVAQRLAAALAKRMPYHARVRTAAPVLDPDKLRALVALTETKEIRLEAMDRLVDVLINEPDTPVDEFAARYRVDTGDAERLDLVIDEVTRRAGALTGRSAGTLLRWGMGGVMSHFLGRIDPAVVQRRLAASLEASVSEVVT